MRRNLSTPTTARRQLLRFGFWCCLASLSPPALTAPGDSPDDRFNRVKTWQGRLEVTVHGAGSLPVLQGTATYRVERHLSYSFQLLPAFGTDAELSYTWTTCSTASSLGTITQEYSYKDSKGCELTVRKEASGVLDPVPASPLPVPGGPDCLVSGFQLQIIPIPGAPTFTSWGVSAGIKGTETTLEPCANPTEQSVEKSFLFLGTNGAPGCAGAGCLTLPSTGEHILNTWSFDEPIPDYGEGASAHYEVVLDLEACGSESELVVLLQDYDQWRPRGSTSERQEGNTIQVKAVLQGKGGCPTELRARRFYFELLEVSSEPGVCMNYPIFIPPLVPGGLPDLAFLAARNGSPWLPSGDPALVLESEEGSYTESPPAAISSFDWGGHAILRVTAELTDGRTLTGHLPGDNSASAIPIPRRKPDSRIAGVWRTATGTELLADEDDGEDLPEGDGHRGDGLTLYEEYRGFYENSNGDFIEGNPRKKDIFIVDLAGAQSGIQLYRNASGLEVHGRLLLGSLDPRRVINPNRGPALSGAVDQHGLYVVRRDLAEGVAGRAVGGPGLPRHVQRIDLGRMQSPNFVFALQAGKLELITREMNTTAHELLHASNVYHHGKTDPGRVRWETAERDGVLVFTAGGVPIDVRREMGCQERPAYLPGSPQDPLTRGVYVASPRGQHSGVEDCILRYRTATVYEDDVFERAYWIFKRPEAPGFLLCNTRAGNGINSASHCPQPRYGDAEAGCCSRQICIRDSAPHEAAAGATPCSGTGGGEVPHRLEPESEAQPILTLSIDESTQATLVRGEPALVSVELFSSRLGSATGDSSLVVSPGTPRWSEAVSIRRGSGEGGPARTWTLTPAGHSAAEVTLDERSSVIAGWWIPPDVSAALEPGVYRLEAELDTTSATVGWRGIARSLPVTLLVLEPSPPGQGEPEARSVLAWTLFLTWEGRPLEALTLLDELLASRPALTAAHWYRAQILEETGDLLGALDSYDKALRSAEVAATEDDEPAELILGELASLASRIRSGETAPLFRRADTNEDRQVDIADAVHLLQGLFLGGELPACLDAADSNDDGRVDISDAVAILHVLFLGDGEIPAPGRISCGIDPTSDALDCRTQGSCPSS